MWKDGREGGRKGREQERRPKYDSCLHSRALLLNEAARGVSRVCSTSTVVDSRDILPRVRTRDHREAEKRQRCANWGG